MVRGRTALRPAAAWILVVLCGNARAEGLSFWAEPGYGHVETELTDVTGRTTSTVEDHVTQQYRLNFDRTLTQYLSLNLGGNLLDEHGWIGTDHVYSEGSGRSTTFNGRLTLGTPVLNAAVSADRTERQAFLSDAIARGASPSFVTESYSGTASWRPIELPELDLRISRVNEYDSRRLVRDGTTDSASFTARYYTPTYDLRYLVNWNRLEDHRALTLTTGIEQTVLGSRTDKLFSGRMTTYVSATGHTGTSSIEQRGAGGFVTRQQLPFSGLSAVEALPATAVDIELTANPLLIDGNTTATAGINVGFGPSASGDRNARHVGVGFADAVTPVNTLYVWFDRSLPAVVSSALAAPLGVYQSEDNRTWSPVAVVSPPVASQFANRIEVTIVQTQARYLKVTLLPLAVGVTTDPAYRELFVTELQVLLVLPASEVPTHQSIRGAAATASARTLLLKGPDLVWDASGRVAREVNGPTTYSFVNGLTLTHRVTAHLVASARGARVDENLGLEHEGIWQWSAGLVWRPVPTAFGTLAYSGYSKEGGELRNAVTALGRADLYEGVSTQASATVSRSIDEDRTTDAFQGNGRVSLQPNPWVTLTAGGLYQRSFSQSLKFGDVFTQYARMDGSVSISPVPAASATGTVSRVLIGIHPTTLGTLQLNYYPLRGDLQVSFDYTKTLDTAAELTTEAFVPSVRWNLSREISLRSSYTYLKSDAPVLLLVSRAFQITLLVSL